MCFYIFLIFFSIFKTRKLPVLFVMHYSELVLMKHLSLQLRDCTESKRQHLGYFLGKGQIEVREDFL